MNERNLKWNQMCLAPSCRCISTKVFIFQGHPNEKNRQFAMIRYLQKICQLLSVCLSSMELSVSIMKYFGNVLRKPEITSRYLENDSETINQMATQYLSNCLVEVDLRFIKLSYTFSGRCHLKMLTK